MELSTKLEILSAAAKYDVSCSSSGSTRKNTPGGLGNSKKSGICHSWSDDGRCISLLKILFSNCCIYDCAYCVNRSSNDIPRATFTPEEVADLTINFYRRNYIEGLFLSSGIIKNPDYTMELLFKTVRILREEHRFNGYIHVKAIPGADFKIISQTGMYVDRMSVNIELPSSERLKLLAPQKNRESILKPMNFISSSIEARKEEQKLFKKSPLFVPAGQSTQLIIGATPDHDLGILKLSENLYKRFHLKRVYYSAYVPVSNNPNLPAIAKPPLLREHRLYQADWLLRFYGFSADELLNDTKPDFDTELDPKSDWALRNLHAFPVEINKVDFHTLLRVPGIGTKSALKIINARRVCSLGFDDLKKIGVVLKRARFFITCKGKYYGESDLNETLIKPYLLTANNKTESNYEQITMYSYFPQLFSDNYMSVVTGQL
jgi:putative DNA modification/repair radical SAM protein